MAKKALKKEAFHGHVIAASNECGKVAYSSRKHARRVRGRTPGEQMRAYRCGRCGLFHVGHQPDAVRRGEVSAADWYARKARRAA